MHRKTLASGILLLFLVSTVSPVAFGINVDESEDTPFLDYISYVYSVPDRIGRKEIDYTRSDQQYQSLNEISYYLEDNPSNLLGGPINSSWPMFCHDNQHTGLSPFNTAQNPGIEKWRLKTEGSVDGGIAIGPDGLLYFGDFHGDVYAVYPNGTIKWTHPAGMILTSTPCIGMDGTVYIGTFTEKLVAINPDGTRKWAIHIGDEVASSPAIAEDGTIYVGVMGPGNDKGRIVAVNPNGTIRWYYDTGFWIVSDPAIHPDGTIIIGSGDTWIYALYPNGTLRWKYKTGNDVKGSASIDDQGIIYMACWDGYLYAFYINGTLKYKTTMGIPGTETNPSFGPDGTIYVSYDALAAIDPSDGSVKWTFDYLEEYEKAYLSSPAVSADGIIYIGTEIDGIYGGHIYAINPDGTLRWKKLVANINIASSPAIAEDGTVYIGSQWNSEGDGGYGCISAFNEFVGQNHPPETPTINAPETLWFINPYCVIDVKTTDPDLHPCRFVVDWGDFTLTEQSIEIASTAWETFYHTYLPIPLNRHTIRVKAIDTLGAESNWATIELRIPQAYHPLIWQWLCERFPVLSQILSNLLNI